MNTLVIGASGFVGKHLVRALRERGDEVSVTGRNLAKLQKTFRDGVQTTEWDPNGGPIPQAALAGVDAVINLAGDNVGKGRWSKRKKERIRASRVDGTRNLVAGIAASEHRPAVLVNASAIGYYGDGGSSVFNEGSLPGRDFLARVCEAWEGEASRARGHGVKVAIARLGVVLGKDDGAYPQMSRPFKMFLGGPIGMGRRWFSWIHVDDVVGILSHLAATNADGIFNATAPGVVTNEEFSHTLGSVLHRPSFARVPPLALRVVLGGFATVICSSTRATPLRTIGTGYEFKYPEVRPALEALR
ncbi:MAG: TIGR01777 family oxidoreductase [Planctomycetota bacterium]